MSSENQQAAAKANQTNDIVIDHQAGLAFDQAMRDLLQQGISTERALAAMRRIASAGNGWGC